MLWFGEHNVQVGCGIFLNNYPTPPKYPNVCFYILINHQQTNDYDIKRKMTISTQTRIIIANKEYEQYFINNYMKLKGC